MCVHLLTFCLLHVWDYRRSEVKVELREAKQSWIDLLHLIVTESLVSSKRCVLWVCPVGVTCRCVSCDLV